MSLVGRAAALVAGHPLATCASCGLLLALIAWSGDFNTVDTACRLQVTHWLWLSEPQVVDDVTRGDCNRLVGRHGLLYSGYGIAHSLAMLPADWLAHGLMRLLSPSPGHAEKLHVALVSLLTFSWIAAGAAAYSFLLLRAAGCSEPVAGCATLATFTATTLLVYLHVQQENSLIYLLLCGGIYHALRFPHDGRVRQLHAAGVLLGASMMVKITNIAVVTPIVCALVPLVWRAGATRPGGARRALLHLMAPIALMLAIEQGYQFHRFGQLGTYAGIIVAKWAAIGGFEPGYPFAHDRVAGFLGPFVSPEKSMFIYDPLLIVVVVVVASRWRALRRTPRMLLLSILAGLALLAAAFSGTDWWTGNSAWGPRQHLAVVALLLLVGLATVMESWPSLPRAGKAAFVALLLVSALMQASVLPKTYNLELAQLAAGAEFRPIPWMRAANLLAIARGSFAEEGRDLADPGIAAMALRETANTLFAFRIGPYVGPRVQALAIGLWIAALALLGLVVLLALRQWWPRVRSP